MYIYMYLLISSDKHDARVTDEHVSDVTAGENLVYAACFKEKIRVKINVYDERVPDWSVTHSIRTAIPGKVSLILNDDLLYVCSVDQAVIYMMTTRGEVRRNLFSFF